MRNLVLWAILWMLWGVSHGEDSGLQNQYLAAYLLINDAARLENEGYPRLALTAYADSLHRLLLLHGSNVNIEAGMYADRVRDLREKFADLKVKTAGQGPPPAMDDAFRDFLRLELNSQGAQQIYVNQDLRGWKAFQRRYPKWEPDVIKARIAVEERTLMKAKAGK